jgi:hypothetical protein
MYILRRRPKQWIEVVHNRSGERFRLGVKLLSPDDVAFVDLAFDDQTRNFTFIRSETERSLQEDEPMAKTVEELKQDLAAKVQTACETEAKPMAGPVDIGTLISLYGPLVTKTTLAWVDAQFGPTLEKLASASGSAVRNVVGDAELAELQKLVGLLRAPG